MSDNQLANKSQAWSALFSEPMSDLVKRYTASVGFDQRLWRADITGSLAHAEMLAAQGILSAEDHAAIQRGLNEIAAEIEAGQFEWKLDLEDVHLNIEARLTPFARPPLCRLCERKCKHYRSNYAARCARPLPPPAAAAASIVWLMATVSSVRPSPLAPNARTSKSEARSTGARRARSSPL